LNIDFYISISIKQSTELYVRTISFLLNKNIFRLGNVKYERSERIIKLVEN